MVKRFYNTESSPSILIIDDEYQISDMMRLLLTRNGYRVDTAESGEVGKKKIDSKKYALIFTDIKMPGLSGNQIFNYLRNEKKSLIPVVGMSGTPWLLGNSNFDDVLSKPCSMKEILAVTNRLIKNNQEESL
jgi:DNA-binding response OmpR family regulator